ncbi:ribosome biogenesis protein Nop53/GLTSCR2 [Kalaharituber pfeilii]|nr:ribosome biogenesis protein Nop53/GLTSCR2 [Kalaharituber pfeilii]
MSVNAPATYKQPSRKGKKAWRKNVDITDVNEGLEQLREELITGGVINEKTNDQLFTLDTVGDKGIVKREFKKQKVLKVDEILNARSAIPAISVRKRNSDSAISDGVIPEKKKLKNWVSHKEVQKMKDIAYGATTIAVAKTNSKELSDPWAEPEPEKEDPKFSFLEKTPEIKPPPTLKMAPVSLYACGKQPKAVSIPDAGISYNPEFEKWDELLRKEGEKAVESEKKRLKEEQEERERLERLAKEEEEERARELAETERGEEGIEGETEHGDSKEKVLRKRPVRKTRAQRNKEKRRKEEVRQSLMLAQQKKQRQQLETLKLIKKAVEAKENARLEELAKAAEAEGDPEKAERLRRKKLGKNHLPPKPLELLLPEELTDSLRRLKPEGNLLKDRFRSLMERGIVETRLMPVTAKKKKVTETEKWSYKDFA